MHSHDWNVSSNVSKVEKSYWAAHTAVGIHCPSPTYWPNEGDAEYVQSASYVIQKQIEYNMSNLKLQDHWQNKYTCCRKNNMTRNLAVSYEKSPLIRVVMNTIHMPMGTLHHLHILTTTSHVPPTSHPLSLTSAFFILRVLVTETLSASSATVEMWYLPCSTDVCTFSGQYWKHRSWRQGNLPLNSAGTGIYHWTALVQ